MLVRVLLSRQQYQQAVETLSRFSQYLDREGSIDTVLEFLALSVVSLHHAGNSLAPAGSRCLQSTDRRSTRDPAFHRQETCQQPAREAGSRKPHAGDCPGACLFPAVRMFLPNTHLLSQENATPG